MPTTIKLECGDRILVIWQGSKHYNRYGVILKIGGKLIVRFKNGIKGFVFIHQAMIIDSDESDILPSEISIHDSEGRYKIDEDRWPIGLPAEISILDSEGS